MIRRRGKKRGLRRLMMMMMMMMMMMRKRRSVLVMATVAPVYGVPSGYTGYTSNSSPPASIKNVIVLYLLSRILKEKGGSILIRRRG